MVSLEQIKYQLAARECWKHAVRVVEIIEERMSHDPGYSYIVNEWLTKSECSTVWLRDEIMEPLRNMPEIVEIGKQFNPSTEWDNTWLPLDSANYRVKIGVKPGEW